MQVDDTSAEKSPNETSNIVKLWSNFQDKKKKGSLVSKSKNTSSSIANLKSHDMAGKSPIQTSKLLTMHSDLHVSGTSSRLPMKDVSNVSSSSLIKTNFQYQRKSKGLSNSNSKQNSSVFKKLSFENVSNIGLRGDTSACFGHSPPEEYGN